MHEIVHLSFGASSNHLHSHFYNSQISHFVYSESEASPVDPHILFRAGKGFTPRALIWELNGGYGGLGKSSAVYTEKIGRETDSVWSKTTTIAEPIVSKSTYRKYMEGLVPKYEKPSISNTLYWPDYFKTIYHPKSLLTLNDWEYDPVLYPDGRPRGHVSLDDDAQHTPFKSFDTGVAEWHQMNSDSEYLEVHVRPILEQCDQLDGLSVVTDADSAWSGITSQVLQELRDDYLPKNTIFTWASFSNEKLKAAEVASRVNAILKLIDTSSLFIPFSTPQGVKHPSSLWYTNSLNNIFFESYSLLSSLRAPCTRISMDTVLSTVTSGSLRMIVDKITASTDSSGYMDFSASLFKEKPQNHLKESVFSASVVQRPPQLASSSLSLSETPGIADTGNVNPWSLMSNSAGPHIQDPLIEHFDKQKLLAEGVSESNIHELACDVPLDSSETTPSDIFKPTDKAYASFKTTSRAGNAFAKLGDLSSRVFKGDEREEVVQYLKQLSDVYGFAEEDSDFD